MDERQIRVLVIGAGVAGSAAAVALRRIGARVTVFEAYEDPAGAEGSFVSLAVNGQRGLAAIGCLERVRARGFPVARQRLWSGRGKLLGDAARGRTATDTLSSVTLMRADLVRELRAAAVESGADVITGERLVALSRSAGDGGVRSRSAGDGGVRSPSAGDGGVRVTFASGLAVEADLVVAADGIWSTARGLLDAAAPVPVYAGLYAVSGRSRGVELGPQGEEGAFNMTFARRATFLHLRDPDGEIWWSAQVKSPVEPARDGVTDDEWLRLLGDLFTHDAVPAAIVAAATQVQGNSLMHRLDPVPVWHDDRVILIGDAAHPVGAGQGASMAVEDALALAAALRDAGLATPQHSASPAKPPRDAAAATPPHNASPATTSRAATTPHDSTPAKHSCDTAIATSPHDTAIATTSHDAIPDTTRDDAAIATSPHDTAIATTSQDAIPVATPDDAAIATSPRDTCLATVEAAGATRDSGSTPRATTGVMTREACGTVPDTAAANREARISTTSTAATSRGPGDPTTNAAITNASAGVTTTQASSPTTSAAVASREARIPTTSTTATTPGPDARSAGATTAGARGAVREGAVAGALVTYARMREERVTKMLKASDDNKDAKVAGALRSRVQDVMMPVFFRLFYERATAWLYDYTPPRLP